jgi:hypothetical protein
MEQGRSLRDGVETSRMKWEAAQSWINRADQDGSRCFVLPSQWEAKQRETAELRADYEAKLAAQQRFESRHEPQLFQAELLRLDEQERCALAAEGFEPLKDSARQLCDLLVRASEVECRLRKLCAAVEHLWPGQNILCGFPRGLPLGILTGGNRTAVDHYQDELARHDLRDRPSKLA